MAENPNGVSAPPPPTNGFDQQRSSAVPDLALILQAIEVVYNPRSAHDARHAANELLETTKSSPAARELGYSLAVDHAKDPTLRHYGLTLLDYHTRYVWDGYDEDVEAQLRECIVKLAQGVRKEDPTYLRNKVAHVWTIFAKRSWATYWMDMDEQLVALFGASDAHREVVLYVLQALAEDVFSRDDTLAATRGEVLAAACIEIFTPEALMADKNVSKTGHSVGVRCGPDGWLQRLSTFLDWSLGNDHSLAVKTLETLGSAMSWLPSATIAATSGIAPVCRGIVVGDCAIRLAAVESLTTICSRERMPDDDALKIVMPLFSSESVNSLYNTYQWARVSADDIDDAKYTLLQKTSKLLSRLGAWIEKNPALLPESSDLPRFFELLFEVARDLSLKVSEPVLRLWTHLLRIPTLRDSVIIQQSIGPLMEMCSRRLVRYEALPEDTDDPIVVFINEDFDTLPEKHMFLGNYRRYCLDVVEAAVRKFPVDAVSHILGQAQSLYRDIQTSMQNFQPQNFSKKSPEFLRVDAQVMLVDASVKGYTKWLLTQEENDPQQNEQDRNAMMNTFVSYFEATLPLHFNDPAVQRRILSSLTHMAMRVFQKSRPDLGTQLLDRFFSLKVIDDPTYMEYSEAAKSLSFLGVTESQKLASVWADTLIPMYDELERRVQQKVAEEGLDAAHALGYQNFLFTIVLHSQTLDAPTKLSKLREMASVSTAAWQAPDFNAAVKDFGSFFGSLGLSGLPQYLYTHNFHKLDNWADHMLDAEGRALQSTVNDRVDRIPHRATRMLLMATFDKLPDSDAQLVQLAQSLWAEAIPSILPNLMQSLRHAHLFGDREAWPQLPEEMKHLVQKILTDRFWQAGISNESMDDFYKRVNSSKHSYEGFASSIRGAIRQIREKSYSILCYLTRLEAGFYGLPELPEVLASNVYDTAGSLSAHQWSVLLNMSDQVIRGCPLELRQQFLPIVLTALLRNLEAKLTSEWEIANRSSSEAAGDDNLGDEMKRESILRMLTYHSVLLVNGLLDIDPSVSHSDPGQETRMYRTILASPQLLGQMLMFLTSALRMRDQRSVNVVVLTLNRLLPFFKKPSEVRDYICDAVLKNAIQSFNEGYFTESQTKLAGLIAQIISLDENATKAVILSLPNMDPEKVQRRFERLRQTKSPTQGAAIVLEMLQGLRGVSIHELGKITAAPRRKASRDKLKMEMEMGGIVNDGIRRGGEEELDGIAGMFG
ncbi:uncharacterized protein PV09_08500 [Verruconis gallopava]|uniref:Uncharacterized protein n=1 Tax=Verruconis gallopava TaxID=253628 RepID=A0A0D1XC51_9PEZI|nr:uncharacterized protein PV09_08500 [Verruconis gallopava]KIV99830.1 hypothetical protein PV09_08500 [Verruconis gallopava]